MQGGRLPVPALSRLPRPLSPEPGPLLALLGTPATIVLLGDPRPRRLGMAPQLSPIPPTPQFMVNK